MTALLRMTWPPALFFTPVIRVWGDSTTNGAGSGDAAANIRSYLASQFSRPVHVVNQGNGGDPGPAVAARFLARDRSHDADVIDIINFGRTSYANSDVEGDDLPLGPYQYLQALHDVWNDRSNNRLLLCQVAPGATPLEQQIGGLQSGMNLALRQRIFAEFPGESIVDTMEDLWTAAEADPGATPADLAARTAGCLPPMFASAPGNIHRISPAQLIEARSMGDKVKARGWLQ
jgi:hypothetical protein